MSDTPKVYAAIAAVSAELAKTGVSKNKRNTQQGYNFRGIDDVYNALAPVLASKGLVILPRILSRNVTERQTAKGGVLFYVVVEAEFDFVSAEDGSKHVARTYGEAMDSADKATNKAMSAAYKYVTFQAFCIPTEGDNDADATTHHIQPGETVPDVPADYDEAAVGRPHASIASSRPSAARATPASSGVVTVSSVTPKPTKNPTVTRYEIVFSDGRRAATINTALGKLALDLRDTQAATLSVTKQTAYGADLVSLVRADRSDDGPVMDEDPSMWEDEVSRP